MSLKRFHPGRTPDLVTPGNTGSVAHLEDVVPSEDAVTLLGFRATFERDLT